jgi:hypothetical protein
VSAIVKLGAALPGDYEVNGLDQQVDWLLDHPKDLLLAVVWLDVQKVVVDTDSGAHVPTVRVRRIEPLGEVGVASDAVVKLVGDAFEARTGRKPIPMDIAEVTEERYSDTLPEDQE